MVTIGIFDMFLCVQYVYGLFTAASKKRYNRHRFASIKTI